MFVHFQPIDHDAMNEQDAEARRHPAAAPVPKKSGPILKNMFGGADNAKKAAPVDKKSRISGHEQSNHDEDHVQQHLDQIDKEIAALAAAAKAVRSIPSAAPMDARTRMTLEKAEAMLDDKTIAIKEALLEASAKAAAEQDNEIEDPDSADKLPVKSPGVKARKGDPVRPPVHIRFNRRFASVDSKSASGEKDGSSEEGMAEAANAIADMVDPDNEELVAALRDAASNGDHEALSKLLDDQHVHLIHRKDENDWNILHEAIRSGDLDSVKLLVDLGADIGAKVLSGGAALWIAKYYLTEDHPVTKYLIDIGAEEL